MIALFVAGLWLGELRWRHIFLACLVAVAGFVLFAVFQWHPAGYTAVIGAIDIVLILVIFKGDIRLR